MINGQGLELNGRLYDRGGWNSDVSDRQRNENTAQKKELCEINLALS